MFLLILLDAFRLFFFLSVSVPLKFLFFLVILCAAFFCCNNIYIPCAFSIGFSLYLSVFSNFNFFFVRSTFKLFSKCSKKKQNSNCFRWFATRNVQLISIFQCDTKWFKWNLKQNICASLIYFTIPLTLLNYQFQFI